jgi:hypothetical protein
MLPHIFKPFRILVFNLIMICFLSSSAMAGGTGAEGIIVLASIFRAVIYGVPSVTAIFWLLIHLFPKGELKSHCALIVRIAVDIVFIVTLQLLLLLLFLFASAPHSPAFLHAFYHLLSHWAQTIERFPVATVSTLTALLPLGLMLIYWLNKWVYSFPRLQRVFIHLPLSIIIALAVFVILILTTDLHRASV